MNIANQLNLWALTSEELLLTPSIVKKLGKFSSIAKESEKVVSVFTFTYDVDGAEVAGFIVAPKKSNKKLPCIIFNRGGTGDFGLMPKGRLFTRIAQMARWGYVVIGSQYPGNSLSEGKDERGGKSDIASVTKLYDLAKELTIVDESRIGMYGESRGGMMTYLCMKEASWIKTALTLGGLTDLENSLNLRPEMKAVFENSFGNTTEGIKDRSVVYWANKLNKNTSLCILHGGSDDKVNPSGSIELAKQLEITKHPYSLHILHDGNHGLTNLLEQRDALIREWFDQNLK